jgi:GxxExxY protein
MSDLEKLASLAIDCGYRIHHDLGPGLLESVYETLLAAKLARAGVRVERQLPIAFEYEGIRIREGFRADLLVDRRLVIEIKSADRLAAVHSRQLLTYLRLLDLPLGLRMNFGGATFREGLRRVMSDRAKHGESAGNHCVQ